MIAFRTSALAVAAATAWALPAWADADQGIGASVGVAAGASGLSPGGAQVVGKYLYRLSDRDWFSGDAGITFGSGQMGCFSQGGAGTAAGAMDTILDCDHGALDGFAAELMLSVRRNLAATHRGFAPFVGAGFGPRYVKFADDDLTGVALVLRAAGGLKIDVSPGVAIVPELAVSSGVAWFSRSMGRQLQAGMTAAVGVEFHLP